MRVQGHEEASKRCASWPAISAGTEADAQLLRPWFRATACDPWRLPLPWSPSPSKLLSLHNTPIHPRRALGKAHMLLDLRRPHRRGGLAYGLPCRTVDHLRALALVDGGVVRFVTRFALYRAKTAGSGISWDSSIQGQTFFVVGSKYPTKSFLTQC